MDSASEYQPRDEGFATRAIHVGQSPDKHSFGPIVAPLYASTNFQLAGPGKSSPYVYSRDGNPTRSCLEEVLASLDNAKYALAFASGMAATAAVAELLQSGDHIVSGVDIYGGTSRYFEKIAIKHGVDTTFVDASQPGNVVRAIQPNTKMFYIESCTNPMTKVTDIPKLRDAVRRVAPDIIIVVDNTFLTPYLMKPLQLGADIAMYSITKYLNGHTDVVMGGITTDRKDLFDELHFVQEGAGSVPAPHDCYMVVRSLKTLAIRMEQHMKNAVTVAEFLEGHPQVERVLYPGLKSHPGHKLATQLWTGVSGMMSFYIKGGNLESSWKFLLALKVLTRAESLGGFESLAEIPSVMTHESVPVDVRKEMGITDNLIRLSVGLESAKDLIEDLDQALKATISK